jgi:hypothetical protein
LSEAVAVAVTVPDTVAPPAGAVIATVGRVVSPGGASFDTVTGTPVEVVVLPAASCARTVNVCGPLLTALLSHGWVKAGGE